MVSLNPSNNKLMCGGKGDAGNHKYDAKVSRKDMDKGIMRGSIPLHVKIPVHYRISRRYGSPC